VVQSVRWNCLSHREPGQRSTLCCRWNGTKCAAARQFGVERPRNNSAEDFGETIALPGIQITVGANLERWWQRRIAWILWWNVWQNLKRRWLR